MAYLLTECNLTSSVLLLELRLIREIERIYSCRRYRTEAPKTLTEGDKVDKEQVGGVLCSAGCRDLKPLSAHQIQGLPVPKAPLQADPAWGL
jgi:hypothetical protein